MLVRRDVPLSRVLVRVQREFALVAAVTAFVVAAEIVFGMGWFQIGWVPLVLGGLFLAVSQGGRAYAAFVRWSEARALWGRAAAASRTLARQVTTAGKLDDETRRRIVYRQIGWAYALRARLRDQPPHDDLRGLVSDDERVELRGHQNVPVAMVQGQAADLASARKELSDVEWAALDATLTELTAVGAACERVAATPLPRTWSWLSSRALVVWCAVLPFGLLADTGLWILFLVPAIAAVALGGEAVIDELEHPFDATLDGVPVTALSRELDINLRQQLGETDLPPRMLPVDGVVV